jgi:predicted glycoside hydrolase/deacetylase ChbG (UPF0249 family)
MIILCADDYALSDGVSRAIGELAAARRLSATSVLVTSPHWPASAARLLAHRAHLSVGLHLDLTLGSPLGPMPRLAPSGAFPGLGSIVARSWLGLLDAGEVRAEIERQLDRFEQGLQFPPDHIDGHQHVHVLPGVRQALLDVVTRRYRGPSPLLRVPTSLRRAISGASPARAKAVTVGLLGLGFAKSVQYCGLPTNDSFAGFSRFDVTKPYVHELQAALGEPGRRHIVMCHPGHADAELARIDPVVTRRRMEYEVLMRDHNLPERIWRPSRSADGPALDWPELRE